MKEILIIQTAFIGDVVLALPIAQKLSAQYPEARIHFLVRKGNESLLQNHPAISQVWVWDKKQNKTRNLFKLIYNLRKTRFDLVVNVQRFFSTGFVTACLNAKKKVGFAQNPFSFLYTQKYPHVLGNLNTTQYPHEVDRNIGLLKGIVPEGRVLPKLYPSLKDQETILVITGGSKKYFVIAPASVWFTKQWPEQKWRELLRILPADAPKYLVGAPTDADLCSRIAAGRSDVTNLAGKLSFLQTAALMQGAQRTFANDSAPLHFATAVGCPTTAFFLNTIPEFGFGPLADKSTVAEVVNLPCRPCSIHGLKACPQGHFKCALEIDPGQVIVSLHG